MITTGKLLVWGVGVGGGKGVNMLTDYLVTANPALENWHFAELVGLLGGPAAVAVAWKLGEGRVHEAESDAIGLIGVEVFIDRLAKIAQKFFGRPGYYPGAPPGAPPPGSHAPPPQHWPYSTQQRLPFQADVTW